MNRSDLVKRLHAEYPDLHADEADRVVRIIFEEISDALAEGGRAEFRGFGSFSVRVRPAHTGRNPKTGAAVEVPTKKIPYFRAGKELKRRVDTND